ncbi:MAG: hypothetical protein HXY50_06485 [Ignavibacteriaceae bacterium]|nr:hypothetical protein [Ignavibacteriaceae bacterium]
MSDIILKLVIDGKEFDAKIKDADKQISGLKKDVQKHGAEMTTSLKSVAGAMGLAFGAASVLNFLKTSMQAYADSEASLKKLEVALGRNASELSKYASELQKVTAFEDDQIVKAMAMIAMFTKDENQIKQLTKATMDFAAAKEMDLVSAAELIAKSIGSETNALGRYGIEVKGAINSTERFSSIMAGLNSHFGGQAAAQLDTYAGKVQNIKNRFNEMEEHLGEKLLPTVTTLGESLVRGVENWEFLFGVFFQKLSADYINFMNLLGVKVGLPEMMSAHQYTDKLGKNLVIPHQQVLDIKKKITDETKAQVKTERELWDIKEKLRKEEEAYWEEFYNELNKPGESATGKAKGSNVNKASAPIREMSESTKQAMGVVQDTTNAMWRYLIIGGRQAVNEWDAIFLAFRNSALQRIGEIVQSQIWDWLLGTLFSFIPGVGPVVGAAAQAVTSSASPSSSSSLPKKIELIGKISGEDIYISNKRAGQRKSDNSL